MKLYTADNFEKSLWWGRRERFEFNLIPSTWIKNIRNFVSHVMHTKYRILVCHVMDTNFCFQHHGYKYPPPGYKYSIFWITGWTLCEDLNSYSQLFSMLPKVRSKWGMGEIEEERDLFVFRQSNFLFNSSNISIWLRPSSSTILLELAALLWCSFPPYSFPVLSSFLWDPVTSCCVDNNGISNLLFLRHVEDVGAV